MGMHHAGKDLTDELELAPHGEENFERVKLVGKIV
jgi:predicted heme/steroid binding protein